MASGPANELAPSSRLGRASDGPCCTNDGPNIVLDIGGVGSPINL